MNSKFYLYMITNKINNKIYIGKANNVNKRWRNHINDAKNGSKYPIHAAIKKYGKDNFEFKIIKIFKSEEAGYNNEIKFIKKYKSRDPNIGYNIAKGGRGPDVKRNLNDKQTILLIKEYIEDDKATAIKLSKKYNISKPCVLDILNRKSYLNIKIDDNILLNLWLKLRRPHKPTLNLNSKSVKLNENDIKNICKFYNDGYSLNQLSNKYNVLETNLIFILKKETWGHVETESVIYRTGINNKKQINENIINDYLKGKSIKFLTEEYRYRKQTILNILEYSKESNQYRNILNEKLIKDIRFDNPFLINLIFKEYCESKISLKDLAEKFGTKEKRLYNLIRRKTHKYIYINNDIANKANIILDKENISDPNIKSYTKKYISDEDIINILNLYLRGYSRKEIEDKIGRNPKSILDLDFSFKKRKIPEELIKLVKEKKKLK